MKRASFVWLLCLAASCAETEDVATQVLDKEELLDPAACKDCHPAHFEEWEGSMHAYAGGDPVFVAMNARGQRETNGELGSFCVQCHAPMALRLGLTEDGLNLDELPAYTRGVTCFFCHTAEAVEGEVRGAVGIAGRAVAMAAAEVAVKAEALGVAMAQEWR